jgi:soluble lytic murein transglycosylase
MGRRFGQNIVLRAAFVQVGLVLLALTFSIPTEIKLRLPRIENQTRVDHAKELYGPQYAASVVRRTETVTGIEDFILEKVTSELPAKWKYLAEKVASAIINEANAAEIDPMFVMAIIQRESRFNPDARGGHGEIGLMQMKPDTARWMTKKKTALAYKGDSTLLDPADNIRFGISYMSLLRDRYDRHSRFYLSAYNVGPKRLQELANVDRIPSVYSRHIMGRYTILYREFLRFSAQRLQVGVDIRLAAK